MKKTLFLMIVLVILSACSHRVVRTGYDLKKKDYVDCRVSFKRHMLVGDEMEKVGEIKLGESGFSVKCSEAHAMEIMQKEACALGADVVNIIHETRPDGWSSCYRCKAEFYKYTGFGEYLHAPNDLYTDEQVDKRVKNDRKRTGTIIGITVGVLTAILVTIALL